MQLYRDKEIDIELSLPDKYNKQDKKKALSKFYRDKINPDDDNDHDFVFLEKQLHMFLKRAVLRFISKDYSNVVLLVGAGASVVTNENGNINSNYGKTMQDISWNIFNQLYGTNNLEEYLDEKDAKIFLPKDQQEKFEKVNFDDESTWFSFPLEEYISNLNLYIQDAEMSGKKVRNPSLSQAKKLKRFILLSILDSVDYNFDSTSKMPFKHDKVILKLLNLIHSDSSKLMVATTNYDLAIEKSLEKDNFTIFDGFEFGNNKEFNDDMYEWVLSKEVNNINTKQVIYKKHVIDLLKIHGSINWIEKENKVTKSTVEEVKSTIRDNSNHVKMIFPSSNKYAQSYEEPYFDLMSRFQNKLHQPNTLLVTSGFSFGDNHISRMIINAIKHNSSLDCLITDYNIHNFDKKTEQEDVNDNWSDLDDLRDRGYNIAFLKATMCSYNYDLSYYVG